MGLRLPSTTAERSAFDRATCELVLEALLRRCGPLVDRERLVRACDDDQRLLRYARDVLGLFASLGQVEHVRRDLWLIDDAAPRSPLELEYLRAAAAARALGPWTVIAGRWALVLHGVLPARAHEAGCRFALTPRRWRPATYAARGRAARSELPGPGDAATARRHVTVIRDAAIAAVTRPEARLGRGRYRELGQHGAHVQDIADAFIAILEHPRLSGGIDAARSAVLPVLGHIGIEAMLDAGSRHPSVAIRRRLSFVLDDALARSEGLTSWFGPDEIGIADDRYQAWRITRSLDVRAGTRPTLLDPHRLPMGRHIRDLAIIDNRGAPLAAPTRGPDAIPLRVQTQAALAHARAAAEKRARAEIEAMDRRAGERLARWLR